MATLKDSKYYCVLLLMQNAEWCVQIYIHIVFVKIWSIISNKETESLQVFDKFTLLTIILETIASPTCKIFPV